MNTRSFRFFLLLSLFLPMLAIAQDSPEMADQFRSDGKIYVVIAVMLIILAGIFVYLLSLGRKISRLEKKMPDKN